jgi:predicted negative regulator of RcsB-dependent stress response
MRLCARRRGSSNVQWVVIAVVMVVGLLATWTVFGTRTRTQMNNVADDVGDPTKLVKRFGK